MIGRLRWIAALTVVVVVQQVVGSKILVFPFGHCLNSHLLNAERLSQILTDSGHDVDMLVGSVYHRFDHLYHRGPQRTFGLVQFDVPDNQSTVCDHDSLDFMLYAPLTTRFASLFDTFLRYCDAFFAGETVSGALKGSRYDLVVVEALDPCGRVLVDYLDVPFVLLVSAGLGHFDSNPRPPSYLPAAIAPFTTQMTFRQRVANTVLKVMYDKVIPALLDPLQPFEDLKVKYGINESLSLADSFDHAALRLVNSDFSIDYPAPIEPDTVLVGGFSVEKPSLLSPDLEAFVNGSGEHGVIIMNFGTIVKSFSEDWTTFFAAVFERLPQRVIWRHSGGADNLTLPRNVKLVRWMPQASLLAHPRTRLFVSHCGLNSVFEAASFGVPLLALPLSGDQFNQAVKVTDHLEMGVALDIHSATKDSLGEAIGEVLADPKYARNAREAARRIADQPLSAAEKITFWIDYVIRHRGARHLRSDALRLPWYQYLCLDVAVCLTVLVVLSAVVCVVCLYLVWCLAVCVLSTFVGRLGRLIVKRKLH